ncbi:MAG: phosphatase PAP2 family protein [Sedimentisphaerales bacterium]|nr:phosphatase PAP2 family protein [Sedimentisphaerales bacterium]
MNIRLKIQILLVIFSASIFLGSGCAANSNLAKEQSSHTQDTNSSSKASLSSIIDSSIEDLKKWPDRLWDDSKATFTKNDNIAALLVAGGASIVMNQGTDDEIKEYFDKYDKLHNWKDESLNIIGSPTTHLAAASIWYFLSSQNKDSFNKERAWTLRTALTITWLTTAGLKTARNNDTPNGKNRAWPSGHTASSFTLASVLDEYYGPKIGIPAYAIASLVGYRMMDTGDHWGSDVVFGATLGWVVGHTVAGLDKDHKIAGFDIVPFVPQTEKPAFGIGFVKRF